MKIIWKAEDESSSLDTVIEALLSEMQTTIPGSDEYAKMVSHLKALYQLKEQETPKRISPETWATIAANLVGIGMILHHERFNVITSKAIGFIPRLLR